VVYRPGAEVLLGAVGMFKVVIVVALLLSLVNLVGWIWLAVSDSPPHKTNSQEKIDRLYGTQQNQIDRLKRELQDHKDRETERRLFGER
jgi:hypothetical protein